MTAGDLLRLLDSYSNRRDPDYVDHRLDFLNAGMRWVEQKWHGREAQYGRWAVTDSLQAAVGVVPLPACYRASAELRVSILPNRTGLARIAPAGLREGPWLDQVGAAWDFRQTQQLGTPTHYAVIGRSLELRPLPNAPLDIEITGTGWADPLMLMTDETVLTQEAPYAVLYAALREVWLYLGDEPQMTYWQTQAERAVVEWVGDRLHEEHPPQLVMETPG